MGIFASAESGPPVPAADTDSAAENPLQTDGTAPSTAFVFPAAAFSADRMGHHLPGPAVGHATGSSQDRGSSRTLAMRLGFASLFVVSAVVLMALGYEAAAIVQVMLGAGWAASTALRGLG